MVTKTVDSTCSITNLFPYSFNLVLSQIMMSHLGYVIMSAVVFFFPPLLALHIFSTRRRDFLIFQEPGKPPVNITDKNFKDKVRLNLTGSPFTQGSPTPGPPISFFPFSPLDQWCVFFPLHNIQ